MKNRMIPGLLLALAVAMTQSLVAADNSENLTCPVSGKAAQKSNAGDYLGKEVYFCCQNCPKAFAANPEKFAGKAKAQLATTGQIVQVACPISGGPLKAETAIDVSGVKVAFCCEKCQGKVKSATADEQLTLVFGDLEKGFTLQAKCPVSDKPINPAVSVKHDGQKVYFCCQGCPKAFEANPAKFADKLK